MSVITTPVFCYFCCTIQVFALDRNWVAREEDKEGSIDMDGEGGAKKKFLNFYEFAEISWFS